MNLTIITITIFFILSFFLLKSKDEIKELKEELNAKKQVIESLKKAFHGYTIKKPALFPENELPFLNWFDDVQIFKLEFIDKENDLMVFANVTIYVDAEHDGDDYNTPRTTTIRSKIHSLEVDICDENGDEVEDEEDLIYNEVLTFLKDFYEK